MPSNPFAIEQIVAEGIEREEEPEFSVSGPTRGGAAADR
jgi:hypothetical protein